MKAELVSSLAEVGKSEWDSLNASEHPFTSYDFLNSLEISNSVSSKTGWNPQHIIVKNEKGNIIGVSPNYLKMHSYGEYIFDHAWANAFENAGGQYYPKVLSAIPFTPATGPRVLINPNNPDKDKPVEFNYVTYKPQSTILEESQQLKFALTLQKLGYNVIVNERDSVIKELNNKGITFKNNE